MKKRIVTLALLAGATASHANEVAYPAGYRDWHHVKSMVIQRAIRCSMPLVASIICMPTRKRRTVTRKASLPMVSVIVFDLFEANAADNAVQGRRAQGGGRDGQRRQKYAATGGWGFEGFKGDSTTDRAVTQANAAKACYECHAAQKGKDYVFSVARK